MRAIIIDDEQLQIQLVENFCKRYAPSVEVIGTADNVEDGIEELIAKEPDLLFLDVKIHDRTGFEILDSINQPDLMVIMITGHDEFAVQAFKVRVMHYLLKPLNIGEFVKAVARCSEELENRQKLNAIENTTEKATEKTTENTAPEKEAKENKFIHVPKGELIEIIPVDTILHLEADGSYTIITTMDNVKYTASKPLNYYEAILPEQVFLRVHHSHIININGLLKVIRTRAATIELKNKVSVPVSESRKKEVYDRLSV